MSLADFGVFLTASILLTLSPGPDLIFVITQSVSRHWKAGVATALGLCSGLLVHMTVVAFGAAVFLKTNPIAFQTLKVSGGLYLLFLAWQAWRSDEEISLGNVDRSDLRKLYVKGITMNLLNPKVTLFFLAFLPQFIPTATERGLTPVQWAYFLGGVFLVQALLIFSTVSYISGRWAARFWEHEGYQNTIKWGQIIVFVTISAHLLFT